MARMSIGDFATATGLSVKALRLYDSMELVLPAAVDDFNGYRWYDAEQIDGARLVARLRLIGMPLAEIRQVLALPEGLRTTWLRTWWQQVEADHNDRRHRFALLIDASLEQEDTMDVAQVPSVTTASRCGRGKRELALDLGHVGTRLFAIADGFGSDASLPSRLSAVFQNEPLGAVDPIAVLEEFVARVRQIIEEGSGTTLTAMLLGESRAAVVHIGDTRLHLVRGGRLERLTRDHTFVQALVDEGRLTLEEARLEEDRVLLDRAISRSASSEPDLTVVVTRPGDRLVLTTDGVHAVVPPVELTELLVAAVQAEEVAASVERTVEQLGAPDNYAVVVIDLAS